MTMLQFQSKVDTTSNYSLLTVLMTYGIMIQVTAFRSWYLRYVIAPPPPPPLPHPCAGHHRRTTHSFSTDYSTPHS